MTATAKQPPLSTRTAAWAVQRVDFGGNGVFNGASRVVKRITAPGDCVGLLRLYWNNGSSSILTLVAGSGPLTVEPNGQYNYDYDFTVDCGLMTAGVVFVEFCDLT